MAGAAHQGLQEGEKLGEHEKDLTSSASEYFPSQSG